MNKVIKVVTTQLENAGCNNGNYPDMDIYLDNNSVIETNTCRCGNGCSGTTRVPTVGASFNTPEELHDYINNNYDEEEE